MDQAMTGRTPVHLWVVGALATLWNAFGAYDYVMTRLRNTDYFQGMMPGVDPSAVLAWIDGFPFLVQLGWALGVWGGLAGALLLLARSRYAVHAFAASLAGAVVSLGYQLLMAAPMPGEDQLGSMVYTMPLLIITVAAALLYYAYRQRAGAVLR